MHSEYCMISAETAETINRTKREGGRVICVGTTSCRTIESWAAEDGTLKECAGWTNIFIYPGYRFKALDCLITNFHLPESTLIMLVSALAGREHVLAAYKEAVEQRYRFLRPSSTRKSWATSAAFLPSRSTSAFMAAIASLEMRPSSRASTSFSSGYSSRHS